MEIKVNDILNNPVDKAGIRECDPDPSVCFYLQPTFRVEVALDGVEITMCPTLTKNSK